MKKNKWLLMLAAITLLAACLFAGLAMADDAGTGSAIDTNSAWVTTAKDAYTVTLNYDGDTRTAYAPFVNAVAYDNAGYYAGEIYLKFATQKADLVDEYNDYDDITKIAVALLKNKGTYSDGTYVADDGQTYDVYFKITSDHPAIIFPAGNANGIIKADKLTGAKADGFSLNFMTTDEMIGNLYIDGPVLTGAGMFPGKAKITVQALGSLDGGKTFPLIIGAARTFTIDVKVVTWDEVSYTYNSNLVRKEGNDYVLYLQELQDMAAAWDNEDTGWGFTIVGAKNGLGTFTIQPYTSTYRKLHFDIDNTDVANVVSDFQYLIIKKTGEFNLIISDEDGYTTKAGKGPWQVHFTVKDAPLTGYPIQSVHFTYDQFTRKSGEYLNLNKYVYMMRLDQLGQHFTKGTIFKQNLRSGSSFAKDADGKYATQTYTKWAQDSLGLTWVDDRWEDFTVEWTSSNPKVAQVVNKDEVLIDTTVEANAHWDPEAYPFTPWYEDTWENNNISGRRLAWYSKQDKKYIYPSQGYVRFGQAGTAVITVKVIDQGSGSYRTASTKITVKGTPAPADVLVTKIQLKFKHSPMTMYVGDKEKLTVGEDIIVKPSNATNKTLTITSSNKKIVKVGKDGTLTAKKPGTVTITVSATDGSGVSKSFKVEVLEK